MCPSEGTHQTVMSFSQPVVGCFLKKKPTKGESQAKVRFGLNASLQTFLWRRSE